MKKILASLVLLLLLNACESGSSSYGTYGTYSASSNYVSDESFINNNLSNRALSSIEGVWTFSPGGRKIGIYKSGSSYIAQVLSSRQIPIGVENFDVESTSDSDYFGSYYLYDRQGKQYEGYTEISVHGGSASIMVIDNQGYNRGTDRLIRAWPYDLSSHNAKFKAEEENIIIVNVNDRAHNECTNLGFTEGSQELAGCKLKLTTLYKKEAIEEQKIKVAQEQTKAARLQVMAAKRQAAAQQQIANYKRRQNSRKLMQQGQRMLSGRCTLGIDC